MSGIIEGVLGDMDLWASLNQIRKRALWNAWEKCNIF
jgi:hypothetical protein